MGLTRVAITRPVFILMVITAMVILGLVSFTRLNAELFPSISFPVVTVSTTYSGASPEDVDRLITQPLQDAIAGIANVDVLQSSSTEGRSQITITFLDNADVDTAAIDVQRRVGAVVNLLPADADTPSVLKLDPGLQPVLFLGFNGNMSLDQLFQLADDKIKPRLESQNGVASVTISGGLQREIQIQVDPNRLRAYGLTIDQVSQALARENQGQPSGSIDRGRERINLRVYGLFQSVDEIREVQVAGPTGANIRLGEVAQVVDTFKKPTSRTWLNGQEAVSMTITKQSGSNEIATVDAVRAEIERINRDLPSGARLSIISDNSVATRNSLNGVYRSLFEAVILTGLVLLVFLHTMRSTMIVLFAIPTSLITTFLAMWILGFTLNLMSSIALVMVIGVLVDDSIVVLENIFRHLELGTEPKEAAINGRSEIGLAAIAITLVDVVVFTPGRLHVGHRRRLLPPVRPGDRVGHAAVAVRLVHAHADARLALAQERPPGGQFRAVAGLPARVRGGDGRDAARLRRDARLGAAPPLDPGHGGGHDAGRGRRDGSARLDQVRVHPAVGQRPGRGDRRDAARLLAGSDRERPQDHQRAHRRDPRDPVLPRRHQGRAEAAASAGRRRPLRPRPGRAGAISTIASAPTARSRTRSSR